MGFVDEEDFQHFVETECVVPRDQLPRLFFKYSRLREHFYDMARSRGRLLAAALKPSSARPAPPSSPPAKARKVSALDSIQPYLGPRVWKNPRIAKGTSKSSLSSAPVSDKKQKQITQTIKDEWFDPGAEQPRIETERWVVSMEDRERKQYIPSVVQDIVPPTAFGQMAGLTKSGVERILPVLPQDMQDEVRRSIISKPFKSLNVRRRTDAE